MPIYSYRCGNDGLLIEKLFSIHSDIPQEVECPACGVSAPRTITRDLRGVPIHYNTQGFHNTDYDKHGDKLERLNREWSRITGEEPPPPAPEVPKNASEKH